ncbi:hypothetical protein [Streptomyces murinus]|uniref:hypothetical protein n=1 Tax=Streptomyces murinus TaxID=33900 RepID=UPI003F4681E2
MAWGEWERLESQAAEKSPTRTRLNQAAAIAVPLVYETAGSAGETALGNQTIDWRGPSADGAGPLRVRRGRQRQRHRRRAGLVGVRKTMAVPALALLLATAGCGSGDTGKRDDGTPTTCRSLLDAAGARFREDARSWSGDKDEVTMFGGSELCRIVVRDQKPHTSALSLRFGASNFPFDSPFGAKGGVYDDETGRTLGPDAPRGQETGILLHGSLTDTLTGATTPEDHQKYLLHAAGVVAKEFGCGNRPVVPSGP